ncbi:zf-TFIIB domain-containing protein [Chondromyces crocatus]|nr:zf-TFIIB domain-containing protein [Chondromyces crocatus]
MAADSFSCPRCGAPVDASARHCSYCAAPIAVVRCAGCFHLSSIQAVHCAGCGLELGLEPIARAGQLPCPDCQQPLSVIEENVGTLHDCSLCGGQFVEHALLRELIQRRELSHVPGGTPSLRRSSLEPVRYRPCPACAQLMNRKNFGESSGVIVDTCRTHGTWFDQGELPRVLGFIAAGGLARARQRQAEERARALKAEISLRVGSLRALNSDASRLAPRVDLPLFDDILSYFLDLLPRSR